MKSKKQAKQTDEAAIKIRVESSFKREVHAIAKRRRLTISSLTRMVLQDYIDAQHAIGRAPVEKEAGV